jgi:hypothetical protein
MMWKKLRSDSLMYWTSPPINLRIFLHMLSPMPSAVIQRELLNMSWTMSGGRPSPGQANLENRQKKINQFEDPLEEVDFCYRQH